MTSLVDVIFLLLLFFMLSSTFTRQGELPLDLASGGATQSPERAPLFLQLTAGGMRLNAREIDLAGLEQALEAEIEPGLVLASTGDNVSAQALADLLHFMRAHPDWALRLLEAAP